MSTPTRTYARDTREYDVQDLDALQEAGLATYFEKAGIWVVKDGSASFAVRPHQVRDYEGEAAYEAEMGYERWLENGGPHAAAIQAEQDEEDRRYGGF